MTATKDWGFPRWGGYGKNSDATTVRVCDFHLCQRKAEHPAPKSPNSPEKWLFCEMHAAEYNANWNFFRGLSAEEAERHQREQAAMGEGFRQSGIYGWTGPVDADGLTSAERQAYDIMGLEPDATAADLKKQYRIMAKKYHPDHNAAPDARERFDEIQACFQILEARIAA